MDNLPCTPFYRVRRSWLLLELLLGYLALALGVTLLLNNSWLAHFFRETGELWVSVGILTVPGAAMIVCAVMGHRQLALEPQGESPKFRTLARCRRFNHTLLSFAWSGVFIIMAFYMDARIGFFTIVSPVLSVIHFRGAWENVKANRINSSDSACRSVAHLIRNSVGRGERAA